VYPLILISIITLLGCKITMLEASLSAFYRKILFNYFCLYQKKGCAGSKKLVRFLWLIFFLWDSAPFQPIDTITNPI